MQIKSLTSCLNRLEHTNLFYQLRKKHIDEFGDSLIRATKVQRQSAQNKPQTQTLQEGFARSKAYIKESRRWKDTRTDNTEQSCTSRNIKASAGPKNITENQKESLHTVAPFTCILLAHPHR
ncbi:MAG: hypothetical protein ATN33_05165 [Epulopiscium sp. Nele67-Bin001]|nr:MAG: hypothetical protein ATN33_05165 [Epulopiscium sp. Nele67-Bin001]